MDSWLRFALVMSRRVYPPLTVHQTIAALLCQAEPILFSEDRCFDFIRMRTLSADMGLSNSNSRAKMFRNDNRFVGHRKASGT